MKPPRLELDLGAIESNVASWRAFDGGREVWAVVKLNAYRLGAPMVAAACLRAGAKRLVASDIEEASELRAVGIKAPILLLSAPSASEMADVVNLNLIPTIAECGAARALSAIAAQRSTPVLAHVAVDTGTGWVGVLTSAADRLAAELERLDGITWEGAYTHLAGPESKADQMAAFSRAVEAMRARGLALPLLHVASTAPALAGVNVGPLRIGIGLYGSRLGAASSTISLRTALRLTATVIAIKQFEECTPLGYGGKALAGAGDIIATLRIGYGDGLPPALADGGCALIRGVRCPVRGAIGMQYTMVQIPPDLSLNVGQEATLVGESDGIRLDDAARIARVLPHQLVTGIAAAAKVQ